MKVQENVPLAPLTTFQVGGEARYFIDVTDSNDLGAALDYVQTRKLPFFILAGGSNVLVSDEGFEGVIIKISFSKSKIDSELNEIFAEAGYPLSQIIHDASTVGLSGMESMYGIPGTIGGAVRGNAGAFGTEIMDVLKDVTALNIESREVRIFSNEDCKFAYRNSFFKERKEWLILSVTFSLQQTAPKTALSKAEETLKLRTERQIQDIKSAGSFFMNPVVSENVQKMFEEEKGTKARERRVPAGWLIEKGGLKGFCEEGACTGERSSNYLINDGSATANSVKKLATKIQEKVLDDFSVELREEVTQLGF